MSTKDFLQWLKEHPHIAPARLEKSCKLYPGTITKALKGKQALSKKHLDTLEKELEKYGYSR